ncbi:kinase suppressor of Ras 2-like isoform X2 [Apostichopus japonicus]|uniref:kinase suppressor of Ras 2-like isoform X2 n=1 Tax=Stichopus japonicus TaxID=307972 RepID=UPI003AB898A0
MKGPKMSDDPPSDEKQLESLKDLQSVIEGRISRLEGLRKLNVSSSGFTQQEIKALENKVIQMFGRQLAIRHRQNDNEINEELEQFPNFQMWLYVMDIHEEAKELMATKLKTLMALVELPESEVKSLMKLCKCTEVETTKLLMGLKSVKKVYRAQIRDKNTVSTSPESSEEEEEEVEEVEEVEEEADLESPPNSPSESSSQSLKHPSSSSLASETDQGFQEPMPPHTPPYMINDDHPSKRFNVTPPSTPTIKKNKPKGTPPPNKKLMQLPPVSQLKRSKSSEVSPHKVDMGVFSDIPGPRKFLNIWPPSHSSSSLDKFQPRRHSEDGTLDRSRRNSHSSPFRTDPNRLDSPVVLDSGRKARTLNNRRSPRLQSKMAHKITHRFTWRTFIKPATCNYCHDKFIVKGYKCKDCKYVCHSKCKQSAERVPSCGLPTELEDVFRRRYENPDENMPSPLIHRRSVPNDGPCSPFSPGESSSNPSSTTSSTPSSPNPYANSSASPTPSSSIQASPNPGLESQFTFPDVTVVDSIQSDQVRSINSDVTLTIDSSTSHHPFTDSERTLPDQGVESLDYASDSGSSDHVLVRKHSNAVASEWDIPFDQLEVKELLGHGRFGPVHRGNWHGEVAIKFINIDEEDKEQLKAFRREVQQFKKTRHENVVLFTGACMHLPNLAIVTNLCKGQTLFTRIHTRKDRFGLIKAIQIATQIAQGMGYLHAKGIVHKDLKSKNIFIENGKVVITDFALFSLARLSRENRKGDVVVIPDGWLCYLSPEVIKSLAVVPENVAMDLPFTEKSDVYAFGTVWFELLTGEWPFHKEPAESIIWKVGKGLKQPVSQIQASRDVKDILMMCWAYYKESRPSFSNIKRTLLRLPRKRPGLHRSPSHPLHLSRSAESII